MNIGEQIYNQIEKHCGGDIKNIALRGVTPQSLVNLKKGKANPSIGLLKKIFDANGIPAEIVLTVNIEGKKGKTKIKL